MKLQQTLFLISLLTGLFFSTAYLADDKQQQLTQNQWQEDFDKLFIKIRRLHPNPWRSISEKKFKALLQNIASTSTSSSRQQTIIKLIRAVSLITEAGLDGHTGIWPLQQATGFHLLPLRLYRFSDGLYIIETDIKNQDILGHRLTAIAGQPIATIIKKVQPYVSNESPNWLKSWTPLYSLIPELLESLNISKGMSIDITTQNASGVISSRQLNALSAKQYEDTFFQATNIAVLPVSDTAPLYLQQVYSQHFWFKKLNETTLYLQYNLVLHEDIDGEHFSDFMEDVEIEIKKYQLNSLIIDIRNNGGGDNTSYGPVFDMLNTFKSEKRALNIYAIIGRVTFSAAINFAVDLDNKTAAVFVGEPSGGSPNQFGDPENILLKNSRLKVRISTRFWKKTMDDKLDLTLIPDHIIELSSQQYFSNSDPVLEKVLELIELKSFD